MTAPSCRIFTLTVSTCLGSVEDRLDATPYATGGLGFDLPYRLKDLKDVLTLEVPDPYQAFPMCEILKATRILAKETAGQVWICARADQGHWSVRPE